MKELDLASKMKVMDYARLNLVEVEGYLSSGRNGHAFRTLCGKVIKITTDLMEVHNALKAEREQLENVVKYYDFHQVSGREYIICMELLDTSGIEGAFDELEDLLDDCEWDFDYCEPEGYPLSDLALEVLECAQKATIEGRVKKTQISDIHEGNMGRSESGQLKVFDQRTLNMPDLKLYEQIECMYEDFHKSNRITLNNSMTRSLR